MFTLLDYLQTHPNESFLCRTSDTIVKVRLDRSCLSAPGAKSRAVGNFYCGDNIHVLQNEPFQGSMYQEFIIIKPVVVYSTECETAKLFINCQTEIVLLITAKEMVHPQTATPTRVDNTTSCN